MSFTTTVNGIFDAIKTNWQKVDLKKWSHDIGGSSAEAVHAAMYFVIAFGFGFLLKKYFKYLFAGLVIAVIAIAFLEYSKMLTIDWAAIKATTGINTTADLNTLASSSVAWVKANIFLFGASIIGLLLGYRLG